MIQKLSKREKGLLYFLLVFIIVVGSIFLLILPLLDEYYLAQDTVTRLEEMRFNVQHKIISLPIIQDDIQRLTDDLERISFALQPYKSDDELDATFTRLLSSHSLAAVSLRITPQGETEILPFGQSLADKPATTPTARVSIMELTCNGQMSHFLDLADAIAEREATMLTSVTYHPLNADGLLQFKISIAVYMESE